VLGEGSRFGALIGVGVLWVGLVGPASAGLVATFAGVNDCPGEFATGNGFATCKIPSAYDPLQSPVLIKFDFFKAVPVFVATDGNPEYVDNSVVDDGTGSLDSNEFSFNFTLNADGEAPAGNWFYLQGLGDPEVHFWTAKAGGGGQSGGGFNLYSDPTPCKNAIGESGVCGSWDTNVGLAAHDVSHITFYNTGALPPPSNGAPEPGTLLLAGAALAALGMLRRRRT
jgi:hypothetical protein